MLSHCLLQQFTQGYFLWEQEEAEQREDYGKSCLEQRNSLVLNRSCTASAAKGWTLCPPLSSGLLPTRVGTVQAAISAHLVPKILHSPLCLGGAVKHVSPSSLYLQVALCCHPNKGGRQEDPGSVGGPWASLTQQDPCKRTGHPLEVASHAKTETPPAQLADFSAELL